jgi:hypothetical protein
LFIIIYKYLSIGGGNFFYKREFYASLFKCSGRIGNQDHISSCVRGFLPGREWRIGLLHPINIQGGHFVVEICAVSVCTFGEDPHDNCVLQVSYSKLVSHWCDTEAALSQQCMVLERQPIRRRMM